MYNLKVQGVDLEVFANDMAEFMRMDWITNQ